MNQKANLLELYEVLKQPRTDAERAKAHFKISDEDWEKLSEEEKQAYIKKLPPRGTAGKTQKISDELFAKMAVPTFPIQFSFEFPIQKQFDEERIVAGYVSIPTIDTQNEVISIEGIKEAWDRCYQDGRVRLHLMHTGTPVGDIVKEYKDLVSGVDEVGLFIIGKIWDNTEMANRTWQAIQEHKLTSFSIGGEALAKTLVCDTETGRRCHARIDKLDLHEISIVDNPANKSATFNILKIDKLLEKYDAWTKNHTELILHGGPSGDEAVISKQGEGDQALVLGGKAGSQSSVDGDSMAEDKKGQESVEKEDKEENTEDVEKQEITLEKVWARLDKFEDILNRLLPAKEEEVEKEGEEVEKKEESKEETKEKEELDINKLVNAKVDERIREMFQLAPIEKRSTKPQKEEPIKSVLDIPRNDLVNLDGRALEEKYMPKVGFQRVE